MEELLARTRESDAEVARLAAGARPAGDADPYRTPRAPDADPGCRRGVNPDPVAAAAALLAGGR